jgi:hypothetical protein
MKALIKSLITLAIGGSFAGTALAGPGDAYLGFPAASIAKAIAEKKTEYVTIALFRPGVTSPKAEKTLIFNANPKMLGVVEVAR